MRRRAGRGIGTAFPTCLSSLSEELPLCSCSCGILSVWIQLGDSPFTANLDWAEPSWIEQSRRGLSRPNWG